jgi:hypothetical protein
MARPPLLVVALLLFLVGGATALMVSGDSGGGESADPHALEDAALGPAATEAAPEAQPAFTGEEKELPPGDAEAVEQATREYVAAINAGNGIAVCARMRPLAVPLRDLPRRRGGDCALSVRDSIGFRRPGGIPWWRETEVTGVKEVSVGEGQARVTASVVHIFRDRDYPSVEEDVIYLVKDGPRWLVAQPSGTFYRAIGYPEPPLRSLRPPAR